MGLKIKTKVLSNFLKKLAMEGDYKVSECILKFEDDGMKVNANAPKEDTEIRFMGWLKKGAFESYETMENMGIGDLEIFSKVVKRFGDSINIVKEGNIIKLSGDKKSVDMELRDENFMTTDTNDPVLDDFKDTFIMPSSRLKEIFEDVKLNDDSEIIIKSAEKKVEFSNTGTYKFFNTIDAPTCTGGADSKFGQPLISATANLDGNLELSIGENYPIKIREESSESTITLIVAPRIDEE